MSEDPTAEFLFELRRDNRKVDSLPEALRPVSLDAGYATQARLVDRLCAEWDTQRSGYKIALTNPVAQNMLGVSHPIYGALLRATDHQAPVNLTARDFCSRVVEVEFAFIMAGDVPVASREYTAATMLPFVASLHPAIEIVNHRFAALDRFNAETLAADNAIHGALVLGNPVAGWHSIDLGATPVRLLVNGEPFVAGRGDRALGNPLNALAWLANVLPTHGRGLRAGDRVTTGLLTDGVYDAIGGDRLVADFGAIGQVELGFD